LNCDPLARVYRTLEYAVFGRKLEKHRCEFLNAARGAKRALLLGDGDGRFLLEFAKCNHAISIDSVEASPKMIAEAQARLLAANISNPGRIRFHHSDARLGRWPHQGYDLVATHFFLDCFSTADIERLIPSIRRACAPGAKWLLSEFQQPPNGWRRWHARCWLFVMYCFFRLTTGLETSRLAEYRTALTEAGFSLKCKKVRMAQLICSELWTLPGPDAEGPCGSGD
jgi:ubiquinone/menaquinone biosynthesis C-methylase UbiE